MYSFTINRLADGNPDDTGGRFLQSPFWGHFKGCNGWNPLRFTVSAASAEGLTVDFSVSVLIRTLKKGILSFSIAYIPLAPEVSACTHAQTALDNIRSYACLLREFAAALKPQLPKNTLCVRYDIPIDFSSCEDRDFYVTSLSFLSRAERFGLKKCPVDIQPPDTVLLDLQQSADDMLAHMKSKWRYNIRLAEKKGVTVTAFRGNDPDIESALDCFYDLYRTTARRDGIAIHAKSYYRALLALSADNREQGAPAVTLYIARHEGDALAAIMTLFCRREAVYLYGASGNCKRNLMPAYLLQWTAINDAKAYGCPVYDFYGIPPFADEQHPMHGLYLFKTGFGGAVVHRPGSVDMPVSPFYPLYISAERFRALWYKKIKKLIRGR